MERKVRLIDANRLLNPGYTDMFDEPFKIVLFRREAIEAEPTVEAIPIEWIKEWLNNRTLYADSVYDMLEDWEKENERRC